MKRLFFVIALCSTINFCSFGQEVCNNGIDDDGDGFVDCFDKDCTSSPFCDGGYIGNDAACQATPSQFPKFKMALDWESPNEVTNHLNRVSIGDLDRDGIPEVVSVNIATGNIFILNGLDGKIKTGPKKINYAIERDVIIGNINNDGCAEIFTYGKGNDGKWRIYAYDCTLNQIWSSPAGSELPDNPYYLSLADFDGDGKVEIYYKDEIVDAHTGVKIVKTGNTSGTDNYSYIAAPVAVDIIGDKTLELVAGCIIYSVNLGARTLNSGALTEQKRVPTYRVRQETTSTTSVADYNLDGFLDVLATGSNDVSGNTDFTQKVDKNTTLFFWDVKTNTVKTYIDAFNTSVNVYDCKNGVPGAVSTGSFYQYGWRNGTGRINIADIDGDGKLNAVYVSGKYLYALDENFNQKWRIIVNEETSGYTGCTMFDFNGDGKAEIVYRDEKYIYIIYGDGTVSNQQKCVSRTNREYPIVADVDADGSTEICVTCASDDNLSDVDFCDQSSVGNQRYSVVRAFKSGAEPWVPARRLWNQHAYFNVNVNDDLTIPKQQQKHHLVFSSGSCTQGPNRPLNNFLNQSPFLNSDGCPQYAAPDISYVTNSLIINQPTCPDKDFTISLKIENKGDLDVSGSLPISFYKGDPRLANAIILNTVNVALNTFNPKDVLSVPNMTVKGDGSPFNLFIVLNDAGTTVPTPITLPNTNIIECDYNNVIQASVVPLPAAITALTMQDNIKCGGTPSPDNGAVRAFVPAIGGGENTIDYKFYWSNGLVAKPIPADFIGPVYGQLVAGSYTVYAIHKTANCSSAVATTAVKTVASTLTLVTSLQKPLTNCKIPDGELSVDVNSGAPVGNFTYAWYQGNLAFTGPVISNGQTVSSLGVGTYTVVVTEKSSGCQAITSADIPAIVLPVISSTATDVLCSTANSGSVTANVVSGGVNGDFTYQWYKGNSVKPLPDSPVTGNVLNLIPAGNYTVKATHATTQCESNAVTATVKPANNPVITAGKTADQTSCGSMPNGSAFVTPAGLIYAWYIGQNTNTTVIGTSSTINGLAVGIYTIKVTDGNCFSTAEVTINFAVTTPSLALGAVGNLTNCTTPDGSVTVNVTSDGVTPDNPANYTFAWYSGTTASGPPLSDTDNILNNVSVGTYTVQATHKTKKCLTAPISATVNDATPTINITQVASITQLPTTCNSTDGAMGVQVSAIGNTAGFLIEWFKGAQIVPFFTETIANAGSSSAIGLSTSIYNVKATNLSNGCHITKSFDLPFAGAQDLTFVSQNNATTCSPQNEGSIVIKLKPTSTVIPGPPIVTFSVADYNILFYQGKDDTGPFVSFPGSSGTLNGDPQNTANYTFSTLTPGFYTIVAIENSPQLSGCKSIPLTIEIKALTTFPSIVASSVGANQNCAGAVANGSITLDVDGPAPETNYTYKWFEGSNTASPLLGTTTSGTTSPDGHIAKTIPAGFYTAEATNKVTLCPASATFQLFDNPPVISLTEPGLLLSDLTLCSSSNGSAIVNVITENGVNIPVVSLPIPNYTFQWFTAGPTPIAGNTSNTLGSLGAGIYFVQATNATSKCKDDQLVQFEIEDKTINTVGVDLVDFTTPTNCLKYSDLKGKLTTNATGTSATGYTYTWSALAPGSASGASGEIAQNLMPGAHPSYTVTVKNNSNNCTASDTYTLGLDIVPITLEASSTPLTFCTVTGLNTSIEDGALHASVIRIGNLTSQDVPTLNSLYSYTWTDPLGATFTGQSANHKIKGNYTVIAQDLDPLNPTCTSSPVTVTIDDETIIPIVTIQQVSPVTDCGPSPQNGIGSASVEGDIINYNFDWFEGVGVAGPSAGSGPQVGGLKAMTYTVRATHILTGCSSTNQVIINSKPSVIDGAKITVLSNNTNCDPNSPNGSLSVSVNGNTSNYTFSWTKIGNASFGPMTGEIISGLDIGQYQVIATDRNSLCTAQATGEIIIDRAFPDFGFTIVSATCGQADGFASLYLTNNEAIDIATIEWFPRGSSTMIEKGPILTAVTTGDYTVNVTTTLGCSAQKDLTIKTEIHPYNGISRNGDDLNTHFHIGCIETFDGNEVKIYNRAGTLVFEGKNYNNGSMSFDGRSNKGVSLMGTNLPDGTYFYIIDKHDGSKQMAGYLELVN